MADFVTAIYNPKSQGRYWQLYRLKEIFLQERNGMTPVGYVRQAGRPEQSVHTCTLAELDPEQIDMFTVLLIGNSQSFLIIMMEYQTELSLLRGDISERRK